MSGLTGTSLGHYELLDRLGRGGMSEVYLAFDEAQQRKVAIKVVASTHADYIERFRREAYAVSVLQHAHILPAYDYGEQEPWHYMVMPYIERGTLRDRLLEGPLAPEEAGAILEQIANALQFAHEQGIIHRDIKPSNILLRDDHYVYLADFGLAKSLEGGSTITQSGNLLGTPEYMAPELTEGPATTSSDLYALGILLYEMVTGQVPFSGETPIAVYWKQIRDQPLPPSQVNPTIPPAIERVILRALEKDPQYRYQTANELAQAYIEALTFPDRDVGAQFIAPSPSPIPTSDPTPNVGAQFIASSSSSSPTPVYTPPMPAPVHSVAHSPILEGQLVLPNNPVAAPTAIPPRQRRFVRGISPYLRRKKRPLPPMEPLMPANHTAQAVSAPLAPETPAPGTMVQEQPATPQKKAIRRRRTSTRPVRSPRQRGRRISPILISLTVIVILIILFGLIALFFTIQYNNAVHQTSLLSATANARATSTAQLANATATQHAHVSATAGVALTATSGTLVLSDTLNSNINGRWPQTSSCVFKGGGYHVIVQQANSLQICPSNTFSISNTAIQADVSLLSGDNAGLLFRVSGSQFYDFEITSQGTFFLRRHNGGTGANYTYLLAPSSSPAVHTGGQVNRLLAIANGSNFKLYINGTFVGEAQDSTYSTGQIGFVVGTLPSTNTGEGSFTNLKMYKL